jgi:hypothetical protein
MKPNVVLILLISLSAQIYGQTDSIQSSLKKGTYAVQFQIASNFSLSSFDGGLISIKKQISDTKAWRLGISLNAMHSEIRNQTNPDSLNYPKKSNQSVAKIQFFGSFQKYFVAKKTIHAYYGYGIMLGFSHNGSNDNMESIGPLGYLGVEWFPHESISISGEYSCMGEFDYHVIKTTYPPYHTAGDIIIKTKIYSFSLNQQPVKLGVSVYF